MIGVKKVKPLKDYMLHLVFDNKEEGLFDVKPYLNMGIFKELKDINMFKTVHVSFDTIEWNNGADICPDTLYKESKISCKK